MYAVLIGQENNVSQSLLETIRHFIPVEFILLNSQFKEQLEAVQTAPEFIFVNLMDVSRPEEISQTVRNYFPDSCLAGIHSYQSEVMISKILSIGYDHYLNVFNLAEELPQLLE